MKVQRYAHCAAPGCFQENRPYSRYCAHHYRKLERTRDLRGRVIRKGELKYPRAECLAFIEKYKNNPAVVAALKYMEDLIAPSDKAGFLRSEFDRLRAQGATPETMLASAMGFFFWAECNGYWEPTGPRLFSDRCFDLNLGRALLGTIPARTRVSRSGKTHYIRVRPGHAEGLGQNLRLSVGLLCLSAARKILKDSGHYAPDERGRLIREAIERAPFDNEGGNQDEPE